MTGSPRVGHRFGRQTLGDVLQLDGNSLNAVRLTLAVTVIVSHAWAMTGRIEPDWGGRTPGNWAVVGFFVISGFLITRSRQTRSPRDYYLDRLLRIGPAFLVALMMTAFFFAPLGAAANDGAGHGLTGGEADTYRYDFGSAASFVLHNLLLYDPHFAQQGIGDMQHSGLVYPAWNPVLYTLFYEALCYVALGVLVNVVAQRLLGRALMMLAVVLTTIELLIENSRRAADLIATGPLSLAIFLVPFGLAFVIGSLLWEYRDRVLVGPVVALASIGALTIVGLADQSKSLAPLPLGLILLYLSAVLPLQWVGHRFDISYGMYVYGWPVHTMLLMAAPTLTLDAPLALDIAITIGVTIGFAFLSCILVEQPALRLKHPRMAAADVSVVAHQPG